MARRVKRRTIERIERSAEQRAERIARKVLLLIKLYAPYDTNRRFDRRGPRHLRNSYYLDRDANGDYLIRSTRRYWQFVEFGTRKHGPAQPHVRPAIEEARRAFR